MLKRLFLCGKIVVVVVVSCLIEQSCHSVTDFRLFFADRMIGDGDGNRQIRKQLCSSLYKQCGVATSKPATSARQNVLSLAVCVALTGQLPAREVFARKGAHIEEASLANAKTNPSSNDVVSSSSSTATTKRFCGGCGASIVPGTKFCGGCGAKL